MKEKEFLDENIERILEIGNAILENNPSDRSEVLEKELNTLYDAVDSYIVEYGERVYGKFFGEKFDTMRLYAYEDENTPVVISSSAYYTDYNPETEQDEENYDEVWWKYDENGEPDMTYSILGHYFPSSSNIKQYIDTNHIKFNPELIEQVLEKYNGLIKPNTENHEINEVLDVIEDRKTEDINKMVHEISNIQKGKSELSQEKGE